jgi:hypothetical protein
VEFIDERQIGRRQSLDIFAGSNKGIENRLLQVASRLVLRYSLLDARMLAHCFLSVPVKHSAQLVLAAVVPLPEVHVSLQVSSGRRKRERRTKSRTVRKRPPRAVRLLPIKYGILRLITHP